MPESTKKQPSWLDESPPEARERAPDRDSSGTREDKPADVPRFPMPEAKRGSSGAPSQGLLESVRANPGPLAIALLALLMVALFAWFFILRDGSPSTLGNASNEEAIGSQRAQDDPFGDGSIRDSGVVFGPLRTEDGDATLSGAGLEWSGTVTEKDGGETVTLEGPTAAQLERGFDLGASSVETGVYAVAQQSGEVLHVTTHTFLPEEEETEAEELTLGTVHALADGEPSGYAYYLDERREGSNRVTRTYVRPGQESYRVSYEAEPGTFVPLLIGWQGFGEQDATGQREDQRPQEGE